MLNDCLKSIFICLFQEKDKKKKKSEMSVSIVDVECAFDWFWFQLTCRIHDTRKQENHFRFLRNEMDWEWYTNWTQAMNEMSQTKLLNSKQENIWKQPCDCENNYFSPAIQLCLNLFLFLLLLSMSLYFVLILWIFFIATLQFCSFFEYFPSFQLFMFVCI